jgi:hypothetical protein
LFDGKVVYVHLLVPLFYCESVLIRDIVLYALRHGAQERGVIQLHIVW